MAILICDKLIFDIILVLYLCVRKIKRLSKAKAPTPEPRTNASFCIDEDTFKRVISLKPKKIKNQNGSSCGLKDANANPL